MTTALMTKQNGVTQPERPRYWASAPVDVLEGVDEYLILADVPGVRKDDVAIEYVDGEIRIHASRTVGENGAAIDYRRVFSIGPNVDPAAISAQLERGVLSVHLPKLESAKAKKITVRAAG